MTWATTFFTSAAGIRASAASTVSFSLYVSAIFKITKDGDFRDFTGLVSYNPERPDDTRVDLTVRAASIDTRNSNHDELLKSSQLYRRMCARLSIGQSLDEPESVDELIQAARR